MGADGPILYGDPHSSVGIRREAKEADEDKKNEQPCRGEKRGADSWSGLRSLKVLKHSCPGVSVCVAVEKPS